MGTRGRDLALWLFFIAATAYVTGWFCGRPVLTIFYLTLTAGVISLGYYPYELHARIKSRKGGFKHVVLLEMWPWWAKWLIRNSGCKVNKNISKSFEVHILTPKGIEMTEFIRYLDRDLKLAEKKYPNAIFLWETTAPLPSYFRTQVRKKSKTGEGFWLAGGWPLPRFPLVNGKSNKNGKLRRGFIITD
ncbi:MAG: hypothetical protein A4E56_00404 [Pelotomaculum sp. PtaU1.Bin065]|nr:MAG: hypothetical protein A4E56_00404 [Pelotomaculum sp. PtaU1.Bin065]